MPKAKHVYDHDVIEMAKTIELPPKIKCARCHKHMSHANFADRQLTDARVAIRNYGADAKYRINCRSCAGGGLAPEIQCSVCGKHKVRDQFAKSQRAKAETARCYSCTDNQVAQAPVNDDSYEDLRSAFEPADSSGGAQPDYFSTRSNASLSTATSNFGDDDDETGGVSLGNFNNLSIGSAKSKTPEISSEGTSVELSFAGLGGDGGPVQRVASGWQNVSASSWHTKSTESKSSKFNTAGYGKPSNSSVSGTARTFSSNITEKSSIAKNKNGFARIPAYKPPTPTENWTSESESDNESGGDDDDDDDDDETEI